jgi:hypothetical protein
MIERKNGDTTPSLPSRSSSRLAVAARERVDGCAPVAANSSDNSSSDNNNNNTTQSHLKQRKDLSSQDSNKNKTKRPKPVVLPEQQVRVPKRAPYVQDESCCFKMSESNDLSYLRMLIEERQTVNEDDPLPPVALHNLELLRKCGYNLVNFLQQRKETKLAHIYRKSDNALCGAILFRCHSQIKEIHNGFCNLLADTRGLTLFSEDRGRPLPWPTDYKLNAHDYVKFSIHATDHPKQIERCSRISDQHVRYGMFHLLEVFAIGIDQQQTDGVPLTIESATQLLANEYGLPMNGAKQAFIVIETSNVRQRAVWNAVQGFETIHLMFTRQADSSSLLWNNQTHFMLNEHTLMCPFNYHDQLPNKGRFVGKPFPKVPVDSRN